MSRIAPKIPSGENSPPVAFCVPNGPPTLAPYDAGALMTQIQMTQREVY